MVRTGKKRVAKIRIREVDIRSEVSYEYIAWWDHRCIAFAWSCTKSFWFLRPMDELLSFKSPDRASESNQGDEV